MIDEIRTATTLAATLTRSPATLDASAFDAALVAARDQRARLDEPFLAPRRPADATDRSTGAPVARNDSAPSGGTGEQAGSRPAADEGNRPATDPQAQVLAARQDAAAASDRTLRNRRLAERSAQAQASQQQANPRSGDATQAASRPARTDGPTARPPGAAAAAGSGSADSRAHAGKTGDAGPPAGNTDRADQAESAESNRGTASRDADEPLEAAAVRSDDLASASSAPGAGLTAAALRAAQLDAMPAAPLPGNDPLNPAAASASAASASAASAAGATAASAAGPAAAGSAAYPAGQADTRPGTSALGIAAATPSALATAPQTGTLGLAQQIAGATPALDPGSGSPQQAAARMALRQTRGSGPEASGAESVVTGLPGTAEPGGFRLELPGAASGSPAGSGSGPRTTPSGPTASTQTASALQRTARETLATSLTLDWRTTGARPEPDATVQGPGGVRSQAAMLLDAIQESRGATTAPSGSDAPVNTAASLASVLNLAGPTGASAAGPAPEPARLENPWPVHDPAFVEHLAGQVGEALIGGIEHAEITLNPRELGPIRIELSLSGENASIAFSATQPETRAAIEQSLPILRNMLSEHGLQLAQTSVNGGGADPSASGQPQHGAGGHAQPGGPAGPIGAGLAGSEPDQRGPRAARGLLDLFA